MANDHYIPQCLTRPWHDTTIGKQSLRYFDFETGKFGVKNSETLFARPRINDRATEEFLNRYIETPFSRMQDEVVAAGSDLAKVQVAFNKLPHTALVGLYYLQMQRIQDAKHPRTEHHLDEFAKRGFEWLQQFSAAVYSKDDPVLYVVASALYFPESAVFTLPLVGQMPAFALPITTGIALVFADKSTDRRALDRRMADKMMPAWCSITMRARRVVIPPELPNPPPETLIRVRGKLREMFQTVSEAAIEAGLGVWKVD